jgi:HK97 family phage major capsid protein
MSEGDIVSLWAKKVTVAYEAGDEVEVIPPEAADAVPDETEAMDPEEDEEPEPKKARRKSSGAPVIKAANPEFGRPIGRFVAMEKAYDAAVRTGSHLRIAGAPLARPAFVSGEKAMAYGAWMRERLTSMYPSELGDMRKAYDREILGKALGTTVQSLGGALVPDDFSPDLIDYQDEYGAYERAVGVTSMMRDTMTVPRRLGQFVVGDIGENSEIASQDKPNFDLVTLTASKKGGMVRVSSELMNDTPIAIAEVISRSIQRGFNKYVDDSGLLGSNGYSGMAAANFTAANVDHYDAALSTPAWSQYTAADIETWLSLIPSEAWSYGGIAIVCHRSFFGAVLCRLGVSAGGLDPTQLFNASIPLPSGQGNTYRGIPVIFSDSMPSSVSSDQITAIAGSFKGAAKFGQVKGTEIATSDQRYFEYDQIAFRATRRFAINNHNVGGSNAEKPSMVIGLKD